MSKVALIFGISGQDGAYLSDLLLKKEGEIIHFESQERHRLVGLDKIGVVAEIWIHTDLNNLSDENDIVRISDDYNRT